MIPSLSARVRRRTLLGTAAALPAAGTVAACSGGNGEAEADQPVDQVTYLTSFGLFGRDAYPYVAREKGFFAAENIEVDIQPGSGTPNLTQVAEGDVQFAAADLSGAIIYAGGGNRGFTAVAGIHQQAPAALMSTHPDIRNPQDLVGRQVAMASGAVLELLFPAYAEAAGIDPVSVEIVPVDYPELIPLLAASRVDAIEQFVMGQPTVEAAVDGLPVEVFPYADYLRDLYGVCLFTSTALAESDPDLVQRFTRALIRGLEDALANPQEAGEILAEHNPEGPPPEVNAQELTLMDPYVQPLDLAAPVGSLDSQRVEKSIGILQSQGAIPEGLRPHHLVSFDLVPAA